MNFGNIFGGRGERGGCDCCSLIWLMFLLSICGCNTNFGHGDNDCMLIILLLLLCNNGCGDNIGCRG